MSERKRIMLRDGIAILQLAGFVVSHTNHQFLDATNKVTGASTWTVLRHTGTIAERTVEKIITRLTSAPRPTAGLAHVTEEIDD